MSYTIEKRYISYCNAGRFGNNVFQYIATSVIRHYLNKIDPLVQYEYEYLHHLKYTNYNEVYADRKHPDTNIDELNFKEIYTTVKSGVNPFSEKKWLYLNGWFQFDYFILENIEFVKSLFHSDNTDRISDGLTIDILMKFVDGYHTKIGNEFNPNDLVIHIRLDDFVFNFYDANIISPTSYIELVKKITTVRRGTTEEVGKIFLIVDRPKRPYEFQYFRELNKHFSFKTLSGDFFTDFARLYHAPNLVCSNSTFSWIAMLIGKSRQNWFPINNGYWSNQQITRLREDSQLYPTEKLRFV